METIKSYTDIDQSKKLAEFLPIESADMWWAWYSSPLLNGYYGEFPMFCKPACNPDKSVPCWSLAALLNILPSGYVIVKNYYSLYYVESRDHEKSTNIFNNPVDACVDMIMRLKELNLL